MYRILYNIACFIGVNFPPRVSYFIARCIAQIRYVLYPKTRQAIRYNMAVVLRYKERITGEPCSRRRIECAVQLVYDNFARYITDFVRLPKWRRLVLLKKVRLENTEYLDEALSYGKGAIALTAHLGNWELAGVITSLIGYRVTAVALPPKGSTMTRTFKMRRETAGLQVVFTGGNPKLLLKAIRGNRVIALLGDRIFREKGITVQFMGRSTVIPRGPATLAVKTGARMLPGFLVMEKDGYRLYFGKMFQVPENLSEEEKIIFLAQEGARAMEKSILDYPEQWLNFSPVWPDNTAK